MKYLSFLLAACVAIGSGSDAIAQGSGTVTGTVTLEATGEPVHGAVVLLIGLGRFTTTDGGGRFILNGVPKGTYQLLVEREHLTAERQDVTVDDEETVERSVVLALSPIHESVTVTTSARGESTALDQFNAVTTLDSFDLAKDMWGTLGEAVQNEAGVAKRSFGRRCCTARSKSLTSLCRLQSHPAQYVSGIPSAAILLSISHPIRCSTRCLANVRARISGPMIAL